MFNVLYNFYGLNTKFFFLINHYTNYGYFPYSLQYISLLFSVHSFAIYYIISFLCFILYLKENKNFSNFWLIYHQFSKVGIIYVCLVLVYTGLKYGINFPRPYCSLPQNSFITIAITNGQRCHSSFPSAHTAIAVLLIYSLWPYLKFYQKIFALAIAGLVAISRITLAMHYPADIIYSILIASVVIFIGAKLFKLIKNNFLQIIGVYILKFCTNL